MDLNNPNLDFALEQELLANALKGYQSQQNMQPSGQVTGMAGIMNRAIQGGLGAHGQAKTERQMRDLSQEERRRVRELSDQISTPGTQQQSVLTQTLGEGQMGPEQETFETVPLGPVEENQRQLKLAMEMMNLPSGRAAATQFVNSGVGFPERWAEREAEEEKQRRIQDDRYSYEFMRDQNRDAMTREGFDRADARARMTGGGGGTRGDSLYGAAVRGPGGVMYRYTNDGRAIPVMGPDGQPFKAEAAAGGAGQWNKDKVSQIANRGRTVIGQMRNTARLLDESMFGTVQEGGSYGPNILRRAAGSAVGQFIGGGLGGGASGLRDRFETDKQQLLGMFKIAADLPAAMMNSNAEMARWLMSLGDTGRMSSQTIEHVLNTVAMWFEEIEREDGTMDRVHESMDATSIIAQQDLQQSPPVEPAADYSDIDESARQVNVRGHSQSGPPQGIDPAMWDAMTPEDRSLFR